MKHDYFVVEDGVDDGFLLSSKTLEEAVEVLQYEAREREGAVFVLYEARRIGQTSTKIVFEEGPA